MSGMTSKYSDAPPQPSFAPVLTSSKISSAPFFVAEFTQTFQEAGLRHAQADIHQDRLKNDRRNLARIFLEAQLDGCQIVERRDLHVGDSRLRHSKPAR